MLLMALLLVGACGGGEGGDGTRPTFSPTRTPTATLPSDLPSLTGTPSRTGRPDETSPAEPDETTPEEPDETSPTEPEETSPTEPEETTPAEPETTPSEPEDSATESTAPETSEPDEEAAADDEAVPSWVWWLLAALVVGSVVAIPLLVRSRRRNAWRRDLVGAEAELAWFAHELLPELRQAGSREQVAGGWAVGQPRVAAAEDRLTVLESTAPDEAGRERARSLRDGSRLARGRMHQITGPGAHDTWALDLDAVIAELDVVLGSGGPAPRTP